MARTFTCICCGTFCRPIPDVKSKSTAARHPVNGNESAGGRRGKWPRMQTLYEDYLRYYTKTRQTRRSWLRGFLRYLEIRDTPQF